MYTIPEAQKTFDQFGKRTETGALLAIQSKKTNRSFGSLKKLINQENIEFIAFK